MAHHDLKIDPLPFADLLSGAKTCEVRNDDRDFQVGDTLTLHEREGADFTGRTLTRRITHIQRGYGLPDGLCVLSYAQSAPEPVQGEAVRVVGVRISTDGFGSYIADSAMGIGAAQPGEVREPLMTVAQHQRILLSTVIRCEQKGAFKTSLECGYQDGHDLICQYHESMRAAVSDDLTNVRCLCCQSEHAHNGYDAGFIAGSGMCQACDAAMPAKDLPVISTEPVEWQYQAPDGSWWGIAKSRVDEARLTGRPIRALYTAAAKPDAELVAIFRELVEQHGYCSYLRNEEKESEPLIVKARQASRAEIMTATRLLAFLYR